MSTLLGNYVAAVPAQQRVGKNWYLGSADAIYQSLNLVYDEKPEYIVVFGADHVYRMDPKQMVEQHIASGAGVTVAGIRIPRKEASAFGVIQVGDDGRRIAAFLEKPNDPPGCRVADEVFASMGNYVFTTRRSSTRCALRPATRTSVHDMGGSIIPLMVEKDAAYVYDFEDNDVPGVRTGVATGGMSGRSRRTTSRTWTLVRSIRCSTSITGSGDLHALPQLPPATVRRGGRAHEYAGEQRRASSRGNVDHSVLAPDCSVQVGAQVDGSVLFTGVSGGGRRHHPPRHLPTRTWRSRRYSHRRRHQHDRSEITVSCRRHRRRGQERDVLPEPL